MWGGGGDSASGAGQCPLAAGAEYCSALKAELNMGRGAYMHSVHRRFLRGCHHAMMAFEQCGAQGWAMQLHNPRVRTCTMVPPSPAISATLVVCTSPTSAPCVMCTETRCDPPAAAFSLSRAHCSSSSSSGSSNGQKGHSGRKEHIQVCLHMSAELLFVWVMRDRPARTSGGSLSTPPLPLGAALLPRSKCADLLRADRHKVSWARMTFHPVNTGGKRAAGRGEQRGLG